ncbi:MAG TPA: hypothetical protein VHT52_02330, partial [Stellaceae bacterium]|nr:hypothetical protein [Stellaceae bacterium]
FPNIAARHDHKIDPRGGGPDLTEFGSIHGRIGNDTSLAHYRQFQSLGRAPAGPYWRLGHKLLATARNPAQLAAISTKYGDQGASSLSTRPIHVRDAMPPPWLSRPSAG